MITLIFDHNFYKDLYQEFLEERKNFQRFLLCANILGYGSLFVYLILLISIKKIDLRFVALDLFSIYTRFSVIFLYKYFEIPNVCSNLFSSDEKLALYSYKTINAHRKEILGCLWNNIYGLGYDRSLLEAESDKITYILSNREESVDWKRAGIFYLIKYIFVTILLTIYITYISLLYF